MALHVMTKSIFEVPAVYALPRLINDNKKLFFWHRNFLAVSLIKKLMYKVEKCF